VTPVETNGFDLGLFHGSCETKCPHPGQAVCAPFSEAELVQSPFAYHAVGHYHIGCRVQSTEGAGAGVRMAYAGSLAAIDMTEVGIHGALEVRIEYGRRQPFIEVESIELDRRRVYDLTTNITHARTAEEVDRRVLRALEDAGASDQDFVTVRLTGRL